jgi:hypothetical protein
VHSAAAQVAGGDEKRLRQIKREIRRHRREHADLRKLDIAFHADPPPAQPAKRRGSARERP